MRLFLIIFFLLYAAMHFYAFLRVRPVLKGSSTGCLLVGLLFLLMVAAPLVVQLAEKAGHEAYARVGAYIGYTWLGIIFLFCCIAIAADIYRLGVSFVSVIVREDLSSLMPSPKMLLLMPLIGSLGAGLYGFFEARDIRTEHRIIETSKLPAQIDKIRIVQISDVHLGLIVREERLGLILDKVKGAKPDLFVSTGDLVDGQLGQMDGLSDMLRSIAPPLGRIAVTGNHEFIAGITQAASFTEHAGFTLLRNTSLNLNNIMTVIGMDDPILRGTPKRHPSEEQVLLAASPKDRFVLLLKHRPHVEPASEGHFDLQLSGHIHKGQIFPFSILTKLYYSRQAGIFLLKQGALSISRGSGTWGPPLRVLAPPEVTIIDLVNK